MSRATGCKHRSRIPCRFARCGEAVTALEYAMAVGIVAVTVSAALVVFADQIVQAFSTIGPAVGSQTIGSVTKLE